MYELLASCVHTIFWFRWMKDKFTQHWDVCVCVCVWGWASARTGRAWECACVWVCMCMSKCAHVWACCLCVHTCECTYVSKYVHEWMCACVGYVWACVYTYADVMLSRWSCLLRQLSCYISLCALFAEPRIGKVETGKLEETSKSHRNCRHVYFSLGWQSSHSSRHNMTSHNITSPKITSSGLSRWNLYMLTEQK